MSGIAETETMKSNVMDLGGHWICRLDEEDQGVRAGWYKNTLEGKTVTLPGTTMDFEMGQALSTEGLSDKEMVKRLRAHHSYVGAAWYQKEVYIPSEWEGMHICLSLERVMFQSRLFVNEMEIGHEESLSTPHTYGLTQGIRYGDMNRLTLLVDNRDVKHIGAFSSAYTEETQTIWNGVIGQLAITAEEAISIEGIKASPDLKHNQLLIDVRTSNQLTRDVLGTFHIRVALKGSKEGGKVKTYRSNLHKVCGQESHSFEWLLDEPIALWDEFSQALYEVSVDLVVDDSMTSKTVTLGVRDLEIEGTQFLINGKKTFLRGTLECCIFPLTGYPAMDRDYWEGIYGALRDHGLNHLRFHSWCPPEIAFVVADEMGIYLQVEGPMWMDTWCGIEVGSHQDHYSYLKEEALRIIRTYGHHPSFCFFSNGNELNGDFTLLHDIIDMLKAEDDRFLYTLTTNWDRSVDVADDFFIAQTVDGVGVRGQYFHEDMIERSDIEFGKAIAKRDMPVVSHEVGQYCVYPNTHEIAKYTGLLRPVNLEWIREDLSEKGLLDRVDDYIYGSGKLALDLYKEEIEAALRTQGFGGFQLLDLHDFPGQSTATVGLLDAFWASKGLVKPEDFKAFSGPIVPLIEMEKRVWTVDETFKASFLLAHYGPDDLLNQTLELTIRDDAGKTYLKTQVTPECIKQGQVATLLDIESDCLSQLVDNKKLIIEAAILGSEIKNSWHIWVYTPYEQPLVGEAAYVGDVYVTRTFDQKTQDLLEAGGKVLFLPKSSEIKEATNGKYFPVFWSPVHFETMDPCGMVCHKDHPVFRSFPADDYGSFQWKALLDASFNMDHTMVSEDIVPIVDIVPNFFNNANRSKLFEVAVGSGRMIICSMSLFTKEGDLVAGHLGKSLIDYLSSEVMIPCIQVTARDVMAMTQEAAEARDSQVVKSNMAIGKEALADSELSDQYSATKGNDGIGHTRWCAADGKKGHWWQVDLGRETFVSGVRIHFEQAENYLYVIQTSLDGENWTLAVNQTGQTSKEQVRTDALEVKARYVRIVYNGLPDGVWASHYNLEVF